MGSCKITMMNGNEKKHTLQKAEETIKTIRNRKMVNRLKRFIGILLVAASVSMIVTNPNEDATGMILAMLIGVTVILKPELLGGRR